ncbi:MAG: hypothetical protein KGJ90_06380 [Patescibacteria group bacterium]|nr:hypothetical protein [Patescibacteria group bacterium]
MARTRKQNQLILAGTALSFIIILAAVAISLSGIGFGFQGLTVQNQGITIGSSQNFVPIGTSIPKQGSTTFSWNSGSCFTVNGYTVLGVGIANDEICVSLGNTNAALICTSSLIGTGLGANCPVITYSKLLSNNGENKTWQTVTGEIQEYNITQTFAVQVPAYNVGGYESTAGFSINWLTSLSNFVWNQAYNGPNASQWQGGLYMAPLFMVISSCLESVTASNPGQGIANNQCSNINGVSHDSIVPKGQGYSVQLSTSTNFGSSIPSNGFSANCQSSLCVSQVNSTLQSSANAYSPSSLFVDLTNTPVYYQIALSDLGPYGCGLASAYTCAPVITLNYILYTLTVGTYISQSTNPSHIVVKPPQTSACPAGQNEIAGICVSIGAGIANFYLIIIGIVILLSAIMVTYLVVTGRRR